MTFSILARDPRSGVLGAAVATGLPAVGGFVLHLRAGAGALATQGYSTSTLYGPRGLALLEQGTSAEEACRQLTTADEGRDYRQLIVLDEAGQTAGWTGIANMEAKRHRCEADLALAGNWLSSEVVLDAMRAAFLDAAALPMIERLLAALSAGEAAGSDARGLRSAAVSLVSREAPPLELRIDSHARPIEGLYDVYRAVREDEFRAFLGRLPTLADPMRR